MREEKKRRVDVMEGVDVLSNFPDKILSTIVSMLPDMQGVTTSILSKRWEKVWKYSPHLNFDQKKMLNKSIQVYFEPLDPTTHFQLWQNQHNLVSDEIARAAVSITSVIDGHIGPLKSCNIRHLRKSCIRGDVVRWMIKLLEKGVRKISFECEIFRNLNGNQLLVLDLLECVGTLALPFEIFTHFEVLELKNYYLITTPSSSYTPRILKTLILNDVFIDPNDLQMIVYHCLSLENLTLCGSFMDWIAIHSLSIKYLKISNMKVDNVMVSAFKMEVLEIDSIACNPKELFFDIPRLRVLRSYNDVQEEFPYKNKFLTTNTIIEVFGGIVYSGDSFMKTTRFENLIENLVALCVDLGLQNARNAIALSFALKVCKHLKHLQINNQVNQEPSNYNDFLNDQNVDNESLPYPKKLFWQTRELCECVHHQLKTLLIKGYTGSEMEIEFVKYIITNAETMETIDVWFVDECFWAEAVATLCLLAFPKASKKLSINLKPGPKYMKEVGGNFEKWVTTLKV